MNFRRQGEDRIRQLAPPTRADVAKTLRARARAAVRELQSGKLNEKAERTLERCIVSLYVDARQVEQQGTEPLTRILPDLGLSEKG